MAHYTQAEIDALPEFSIGGQWRVVTDPKTGESRREREPQRYLIHKDAGWVMDGRGDFWSIFTDQDGKTWKQRGI